MFWPFTATRRLRALGILGMNRRNAHCILDHNPRKYYPVVDDKSRMQELCRDIGVPTPKIYATIDCPSSLRRLPQILGNRGDFVVKPNHGCAGRGILVLTGKEGSDFIRHNSERITLDRLRQHLSDILSGMYSLGARPDQAMLQERVIIHPVFDAISYKGIPDVRVIVYRGEAAMAMLRLPTCESGGRANLHQGGIGTGVDLATGITHHAVQHNRMIDCHPDTGRPVVGLRVPYWHDILDIACRAGVATGLGYVGIDIIVDARKGPMLLEANARPGLAIQIANARGLLPALTAIDAKIDQTAERRRQQDRRRAAAHDQQTLRKSA
jgi:alpha-L-glutamate ligase-like protein